MYDKIIDSIYDEHIREFAQECVGSLPIFYRDMNISVADEKQESMEHYTNDLYMVVRTLLGELDADDIIYDMFAVAVILQFAGRFDVVHGEILESTLYPLEVRGMFKEFEPIIGRDLYSNIMMIIESQMGLKSPIPQVIPELSEPVFVWVLPLANAIVRTHNI